MGLDLAEFRYIGMIGTGGIGSGVFFALDGEHTLGREESRSGRFLDRRDYCKLHIISHYVKALLGSDFPVLPIGKVGADPVGAQLLDEMAEIGLDLRYVERVTGEQTLYAVCFIYPDGSGGNLSANDSACARVTAQDVAAAEADFARLAGRAIALAAPEVPLAARRKVLELGTRYGLLRVASFTSAEMASEVDADWLRQVDLLALNVDEAAAAAGISAEARTPDEVVEALVSALAMSGDSPHLAVTAGAQGSWCWDGHAVYHRPALPVTVASTAGAGDAHLAGILAGLAAGLPLAEAHELGALTAALSVTSPHTINKAVNRERLRDLAAAQQMELAPRVGELLAR